MYGELGGGPGGPNWPDGYFVVPPGAPHAGRILAGGRWLLSDDRGATWREAEVSAFPASNDGVEGDVGFFTALPSGRILHGGRWGVGASDDGGDHYAPTPIWGVYRFEVFGLAALATPGSVQSGAPDCGLADASLCDGVVAVGTDARNSESQLWRSNDGGRTWSDPVELRQPYDGTGGLYSAGVVSVGVGPGGLGRAVAVMGRGVVYTTADGGQTWQPAGRMPIRLGGPSHRAWLVRLGPDGHLWVSTTLSHPEREWMYRSAEPAAQAFVVASEAPPSEAPRLGVTVRPNPSSGRVSVVVTSASAEAVRVVVVDAQGREVAVVVDGPVSGERTVSLDTASLAPGMYVVRASAGEQRATARLVIAR